MFGGYSSLSWPLARNEKGNEAVIVGLSEVGLKIGPDAFRFVRRQWHQRFCGQPGGRL